MLKKLLLFSLALMLTVNASSYLNANEDNKIVYEKDYFEQFNITNANDALKRIPGVESIGSRNSENYEPGGSRKRGFGSSGTQILINGERQSSKSNSIIKTLERINADSLIRIEVIRGSEAGLDVRSDGVIVNIIADSSLSKSSGTWSTALGFLTSGDSNWRGTASWATKIKNTDLVLGLERIGDLNSRKYNEFTVDQEQSLLYLRLRETIEYQSGNRINLDLNSKINDKNTLRINTLVWFDGKENSPQIQEYFLPTDIKNENFYKKINWDRKENNDGWEFGGDWEHQINKNNSFKLRVVLTEENEDQIDISFLDDTINSYKNSSETNNRKENERIIRLSFNKLIGKSSSLEYGVESAYNKLDRTFNLIYLDSDGKQTSAGLINTSGEVEEDRYEGFLSYNLPLSNKIRAELALNYEWSEISQSGDVNLSREFQYWKPRIDLKWDYKENRQLRLNIERNVGQINFDDFISSFDQFEETIRAGNPDLKPETSWELKLEHEWRLPNDGGVITLKGLASEIDGPVDRLPIDGYAGIGNLGSGERTQARIDGSIRINELLKGGVFRFMGYLQSTEVNDPVTNIKRDFSWYKRWETMIGIRQDVPGGKYNWGIMYRSQSQFNIYDPYLWGRFAQDPTLGFVFTAKINPQLNLNLMAKNIIGTNFGFGRKLIYNGFKSNNDLLIQENFDINEHSFFKIELEGTF
ncbi:MAG: TonB-dependent receptor [Pseudomonadota bacterium]|nr:TonB-dependent receptor [Pseudomonadota bacterium]